MKLNSAKGIFAILMLVVSMLNPGCKHERPDAKAMYLKYINSKILPNSIPADVLSLQEKKEKNKWELLQKKY